jgi:ribosomal protein S18 acetylase RimI-like enzyme
MNPPEPEVALVPVSPSEAGAVSEMAARIWPAAYGDILPAGQIEHMLAWMYDPERIRRDLAEGVAFFWVVAKGGRIGFLAAGPVEPGSACPLHKCYLLPETQGRGLGSKALELLCALLVASGASSVELRVNRHNRSAIGFYGKNGFLTYAEDCREIGGGFVMDDFLMRRDLGAPAAEAGE